MDKKRVRKERVGSFFTKEPMSDRQKKRLRDMDKIDKDRFVEPGSPEDIAELNSFRANIEHMTMDMIEFTERGNEWSLSNEDKIKKENVQRFNDIYQKRMMLVCIAPLTRGISAYNVVQSVGMSLGMVIGDKKFRENLHRMVANWKRNQLGGGDNYKTMVDSNPKAVEFIDKHLAASNGGRIPFTEQSAAAMNINLAKQYYDRARGGEDKHDLLKTYEEARDMLYKLAEADGIEKEQLDLATRKMYGRLSKHHPELRYIYHETAYNEVVVGDYEDDVYTEHTDDGRAVKRERFVWNGKYNDAETYKEFEGMFDVRVPMNIVDFKDIVSKNLKNSFDYVDPKDFDKFANGVMYSILKDDKIILDKEKSKDLDERFKNEMSLDYSYAMDDFKKMGYVDGLNDLGILNETGSPDLRKAFYHYTEFGDVGREGMSSAMYIAFAEQAQKFGQLSPEHEKAVFEWSKKIANKEYDFQKFFDGDDFEKESQREKPNDKSKPDRRLPELPSDYYDVDNDYTFGD